MCLGAETLLAVSAAMTAMQAAASYSAQSDAADKQDQKNKIDRQNLQSQRDTERMDAERAQQQAQEEAASSVNSHAHAAFKDMASFDAIASEAGGGVTSDRARAALGIAQGQDLATITSNARKQQAEIGFGDLASASRQTQANASIQSVQRPSLLQAGLTIAGAGVKYQTDMNKLRASTGSKSDGGGL